MGPGAVVFLSAAAGLAAWALLALLERITAHARVTWAAAAPAAFLLSYVPLRGSKKRRTRLGLLHVLVAAVLIPILWRTASADANSHR
ncbi:hypothetical protein FL583_03975 [Cryptosporangium phraense]|uniref:Uncharacterized protein n=1 Tax=Cryptosporangium phraense TaxID=2593070 RepID=A0A545AZ37_9ACTN|nr:hypothetical protein FL583_03975 [Cryptosporangium phraense]